MNPIPVREEPLQRSFNAPAQAALYRRYGDPRTAGWQSRHMTLWELSREFPWFPKERIFLNKDFLPLLRTAFSTLQQQGLHREIRSCDGAFCIRNVRGGSALLSVHSWGAAIDLNAAENPLGSAGAWSEAFLAVMERCGLYCGVHWHRKDPMHFSMVNG